MKLLKYATNLLHSLYKSIKRFPVSIAFSTAFVIIMIITSEINSSASDHVIENLQKTSMILALGFALSLCIKIYFEKKQINKLNNIIIAFAVSNLFLILYYLFLLKDFNMVSITRYIGITLALYICFIFIPYLRDRHNFELYVIKIFGYFFITIIYSLVLFLGVCAILLTIDNLLEINVPSNFYYYTFLIVSGIFAPTYFLGTIPPTTKEFTKEDYPHIFKVLVLYIVIPLISIYTLILYIYFIKIIVTVKWPVGLVSHLVLWYSVISCAVLFFISPIYKDNKLANKFMKILPKSILPLIILMFFSIGIRIKAYGITENRYYVIALSLWVLGVMIYFSFTKKFNNIFLPIAFCIIILISVFGGPLSSYSVSMRSQNNRLEKILIRNNMLKDNKIVKNDSISEEDKYEINSIIGYFKRDHKVQDIKYVPDNFKVENMKDIFGFSSSESLNYSNNRFYFNVTQANEPINISGYDYMFDFRSAYKTYDTSSIKISYDDSNIFKVYDKNNLIYTTNMNDFGKKLIDKYGLDEKHNNIPQNDMEFYEENSKIKIKFFIDSLYGSKNLSTQKITVEGIDFYVIIKVK